MKINGNRYSFNPFNIHQLLLKAFVHGDKQSPPPCSHPLTLPESTIIAVW